MIEFLNINKSYGKKQVLKNISFSVGSGVICGLLGLNGAGKSTLMKIMCSLVFPNSGNIFVNCKSILKIENCLNKKTLKTVVKNRDKRVMKTANDNMGKQANNTVVDNLQNTQVELINDNMGKQANNTVVDNLQNTQVELINDNMDNQANNTVVDNLQNIQVELINDNMDNQANNTVVDNLQNIQVELINDNSDKQANNTVIGNLQNTQSKPKSNNLDKCLDNNNSIGFMIESPAFYNNLTGRQNLKAFASFFPNANCTSIFHSLFYLLLKENFSKARLLISSI